MNQGVTTGNQTLVLLTAQASLLPVFCFFLFNYIVVLLLGREVVYLAFGRQRYVNLCK